MEKRLKDTKEKYRHFQLYLWTFQLNKHSEIRLAVYIDFFSNIAYKVIDLLALGKGCKSNVH